MSEGEGRPSLILRTGYRVAYGVAVVAAVFCLSVGALMLVNYARTRAADPLNSRALEGLRGELRENPQSEELKRELRALDLLARRAYFTSISLQQTGGLMLLGGVIVLLVALKTQGALSRQLPDPGAGKPFESAALGRWLVASTGAAVMLASAVLIFIQRDSLVPDLAGSTPMAEPPAASSQQEDAAVSLWEERGAHWPTFRGPDGIGWARYPNTPVDWDGASGRNVLWKVPMPRPGFSSPVVWGDRVFLTGGDEEVREVYCFHATTGALLWRHPVDDVPGSPAEPPQVTEDTGHAAPTMATDGTRAFAIFSTGDLVALDFEGQRVWEVNLGEPENLYGHASSLMTFQDLLFVQFDHGLAASVIALRGATGEVVWEQPREVETSWVSPIVVATEDRTELVLSGNPFVISYQPRTGEELWRVECMSGELAPSPAFAAGTVFVANEYARLAAIRLGAEPVVVWESEDDLPDVPSPLATGEYVFLATGGGVVTCLDQDAGNLLWQQEFDEGFYASPILVGERVYLMDRSGVMRIFRAGGEYHALGAPELGEPSTCTAAFLDGRIYIRGAEHLFCIASGE